MEPITIEGGKGTLELRADGILNLRWMAGLRLETEDAKEAMQAVNDLCGDSEHPMLVDMATTESVSRGARAVFSIPCSANRIALLGNSAVDRVIANFFLGVHTPPCPTRFFTSRPAALKWLLQDQNAVPGDTP
ncbi:hypothetical protein D477_010676 [Arthrobacter crystallopoietes BAB-32]|uniref:DUF7793 domain-containing protein n=1 Tax=Arthrobacter crystallopoietes BAB-32 TaxID=1246476 RepID=N1UV15_9MICC|nr:STAS/SEC14 domain-containing protein [Arthrobacter crystallopoietes]EMY34246.1 hypothetical protein D477_010676 [Arthrobacter crystallopoietes BAB-32]